ncbi:MAG: hypothetical protein E6Q76_07300 [Rhizobium sp.]|nr:MAG: hypothetical protein E6Q76_07300 [Rhizobium sp.]
MSLELLYTSAPRGLKQGSRGFCTVLCTEGLATPLATALEGLSGYRPIYPHGDPQAAKNPVVSSHVKLQAAGRTWSVLSRIADCGLDYSQRANKLAHHVVLEPTEFLEGGPANLLATPGMMRTEWNGVPQVISSRSVLREAAEPTGVCEAWRRATGDAGWAGVLAESFLRDPDRMVIVLYSPGQEILPLFREAISLLPPARRWDVTFSTYFTGVNVGSTCVWRAMVHGSKEALESIRFIHALRLDLTRGSLPPAKGGLLVEAARAGTRPVVGLQQDAVESREELFEEAVDEPTTEVASSQSSRDDNPSLPPRLLPNQRSNPGGSPPGSRGGVDEESEAVRRRDHARLWYSLGAVALLIAVSIGVAVGTGRMNPEPGPGPVREGVAEASEEPEVRLIEPVSNPREVEVVIEPPADAEQPENRSDPVPAVEPPAPSPTAVEAAAPRVEPAVPGLRPAIGAAEAIPNDKKGTIEVVSAPDVGASDPVLLIPSWLDGVFGVTKSADEKPSKELEIFEKENQLGGAIAKIKVVATEGKPFTTIKLEVISPKAAQRLKWCGLLVETTSPDAGKQPIYLGSFPLNPAKLPCQFGKKHGPLYWPIDAPVTQTTGRPTLRVERLVVAFGGAPYSFVTPMPEAAVTCELTSDQLAADLGLANVPAKDQLTMTVAAALENKRPSLRIELAHKATEGLLQRLHDDLKTGAAKFSADYQTLRVVKSADLDELIKEDADRDIAFERAAKDVKQAIDNAIKSATPDTAHKLMMAQSDFESLHKGAIRYRMWVERFRKVTIVAARIRFDMRPLKGGDHVAVDVVNFDNTDAGSSKTEGGKR